MIFNHVNFEKMSDSNFAYITEEYSIVIQGFSIFIFFNIGSRKIHVNKEVDAPILITLIFISHLELLK